MLLLIIVNFRPMGFYEHQDIRIVPISSCLGIQEEELIYDKIHIDAIRL